MDTEEELAQNFLTLNAPHAVSSTINDQTRILVPLEASLVGEIPSDKAQVA